MSNIISELKDKAVSIYKEVKDFKKLEMVDSKTNIFYHDPIIEKAMQLSLQRLLQPDDPLFSTFFSDSDFADIAPKKEELEPFIGTPYLGYRIDSSSIVNSLFSSALVKMFLFNSPNNEETFIETVLENLAEMKKTLKDKQAIVYSFHGIAGLSLPENISLNTPWGRVCSPLSIADYVDPRTYLNIFGQPLTQCILIRSEILPIIIDRSNEPKYSFDSTNNNSKDHSVLFPVACALASNDPYNPIVPIMTWTTRLIPFISRLGYSMPLMQSSFSQSLDFGDIDRIKEIEKLSIIIDNGYTSKIDVALKRLISSVSQRRDYGDALIDAVMAWENLFGTSSEVNFRVTAALAKIFESDLEKRKKVRKRLKEIYDIRSRIVHGSEVKSDIVQKAQKDAIGFTIQALKMCFNKGHEWLSKKSEERSDSIILE